MDNHILSINQTSLRYNFQKAQSLIFLIYRGANGTGLGDNSKKIGIWEAHETICSGSSLVLEIYQEPRKELVENEEQLFIIGGNTNYM